MSTETARGELIVFEYTDSGPEEHSKPFATLDELYQLCQEVEAPMLIGHVVLWGPDGAAKGSNIAFTFRLMTRPEV